MPIKINNKKPIVKQWSSSYTVNENTPIGTTIGMVNAQPPSSAGMTGAQQTANDFGSGDRWDNKTHKKTKAKVKNKKTNEAENVNPYDKLGNLMLKKLNIPSVFGKTPQNGIKPKHKITKL